MTQTLFANSDPICQFSGVHPNKCKRKTDLFDHQNQNGPNPTPTLWPPAKCICIYTYKYIYIYLYIYIRMFVCIHKFRRFDHLPKYTQNARINGIVEVEIRIAKQQRIVCCSVLQWGAACCSVLWCVAKSKLCCGVLQQVNWAEKLERLHGHVFVCVCVRERERESAWVCACVRACVCSCECVCDWVLVCVCLFAWHSCEMTEQIYIHKYKKKTCI